MLWFGQVLIFFFSSCRHWATHEKKAIRLVLDEAHQILTQRDFRPMFTKLLALAQFTVQKIFLTASLPLRLERAFLMGLGLPLSTRIVRTYSDQPQISYNIVRFSSMNTDEIRLAIDCAKLLESLMEADQQGVIFCTTKNQAKELHSKFTKCSSYSDLPAPERGHNELIWKNGDCRWITSTTGLIQGIDLSNIDATVFLGMPYGLLNLYQGFGRGGRDGRKCWSVMLCQSNAHLMLGKLREEDDIACQREGDESSSYVGCQRVGFSQLLDGRDMPCAELTDSHLCDQCDPMSEFIQKIDPLIIDPLSSPVPTAQHRLPQQDVDPDFESFALDLMAINVRVLDQIPALTQNPASSATNHPPPPFHLPPIVTDPAINILRDTSFYHLMLTTKKKKTAAMHAMVNMFFGKCVVCWAYQEIIVPRHNDLWVACQLTRSYVAHMVGWQALKKKICFTVKYQYCYKCQLPQTPPFMPSCHPNFESGDRGFKMSVGRFRHFVGLVYPSRSCKLVATSMSSFSGPADEYWRRRLCKLGTTV